MQISNLLEGDNIVLIFLIIASIIFLIYVAGQKKKQKLNCKLINSTNEKNQSFYSFKQLIESNYFKSGTTNDYSCRLKDFYIKSSYNTFCSGSFKNDYVDVCALKNCAKNGVRALDMQIFSVNGMPVIASNTNDSNVEKNTYNSINLKKAIQHINEHFLTVSGSGNVNKDQSDDPLFLNLRIHYGELDNNSDSKKDANKKKKEFYGKIYNAIIENISDKNKLFSLYQRKFNSNYDEEREFIVTNLPFDQSYKKIFIFANINGDQNSEIVKDTSLNEIVDLYKNDYSMSLIRSDDIADKSIISYRSMSNQKIIWCLPPLGKKSMNYDFINAFANGIQFVAMNFQTNDSNLEHYNNFFKRQIGSSSQTASSPYIKKPDHMIDTSVKDPPLFSENTTYTIESLNGLCQDNVDSNIIDCLNPDPSYNNYQIFKFEKLSQDRYALKTLIEDKYCEISPNNEIVCESSIITKNAQFLLNKTTDGKYTIKGSDNEKYCTSDSNNSNIICDSSYRSEKGKFLIEKRIV
jgi:hypothetical protein